VASALSSSKPLTSPGNRLSTESWDLQFHESAEYASFPGKPDEKYVEGLVAVRIIESRACLLLKYFSTVVEPVDEYALVGEERASYELTAKRGYRPGLSVEQALVHGVNVIAAGKSSSQYVGGEIRGVQVQGASVIDADSGKIHLLELHVGQANRLMTELMWQAADQSTSPDQYERNLSRFCNSMTATRSIYGVKGAWQSLTLGRLASPDDDDEE
jgi:hypothetical protein